MAVTTRKGLIEYCLRDLGAPVVEVNIDDQQIEDRVDEAIEYWRIYHYEGTEKFYLKHQLKGSTLEITTGNGDDFKSGTTITGTTSGATATLIKQTDGVQSSGNILIVRDIDGTFQNSEDVTDGTHTATLALEDAVTLGEFDLKYIAVPDLVYGVSRMIPITNMSMSKSLFDRQYQLRLQDLYDLSTTSITYYHMSMNHLSLLDQELNAKPAIEFNRLQGRVYPRIDWNYDVVPGDYVILEAFRALDPQEFKKMFSEPWLKHYTTALLKRNWGTNLKKFAGLQLPGGVSMDGQALYDEAINEIKELESDLRDKSAPLNFFMG